AASAKFGFNQATWQAMSVKEQNKLVALAAALLPDVATPETKSNLTLPNITPPVPPVPHPQPPVPKTTNGDSEPALFPPGGTPRAPGPGALALRGLHAAAPPVHGLPLHGERLRT